MAENTSEYKKEKLIALSAKGKEYAFKNPLDMKIKYMGKKVKMRIFEDPDGFTFILWKNKKYPIEIIEKKQNKYTIMLNSVWHTFTVETPFSLQRKKYLESQEGESSIVKIEAPMPGKIIDICIEEGSSIAAGEAVVILEAMKMQNEITSHIDGVIKSISVKANETVMKDDILIEIERK